MERHANRAQCKRNRHPAYNQDAQKKPTFQVKALSRRSAAGFGKNLAHMYADYVIIYRIDQKACYILRAERAKELAHPSGKDNNVTYWIEPRDYETDEFRNQWNVIGPGFVAAVEGSPPDIDEGDIFPGEPATQS